MISYYEWIFEISISLASENKDKKNGRSGSLAIKTTKAEQGFVPGSALVESINGCALRGRLLIKKQSLIRHNDLTCAQVIELTNAVDG